MSVTLPLSDAEIARHLAETSRTFALTIPLLGAPLEREIGVAYLLFRVADTLEDAPRWGRAPRAHALEAFARWVDAPDDDAWLTACDSDPPTDDAACMALLADAPRLLATARALPPASTERIAHHVVRTARGMSAFVATQSDDGALTLPDMAALARYCYAVAGIVGELLTDLFVLAEPALARSRGALDRDAAAFGEGLQLVNILKDAADDAREGRAYLPEGVPREQVVAQARHDLVRADAYISALRGAGASPRVLAFTELPVRLAVATLDRLDEGRAKLTRQEVAAIAGPFLARAVD